MAQITDPPATMAEDDLAWGVRSANAKLPGAFRTIGEVAQALNIRQHVLRYWEEQFPMLNPVKRSGNRRYYRPQDVALIEMIARLVHHQGYTLRGARLALEAQAGVTGANAVAKRTGTPAPAATAQAEPAGDIEDRQPELESTLLLAELLAIRAALAEALEA